METADNVTNETLISLAEMFGLETSDFGESIHLFANADHRYLKDLRINISKALKYTTLTSKESMLLALAVAVNEKSALFSKALTRMAMKEGANDVEIADTHACVSLLNINNVFYRFRHFTEKDFYKQSPAGIKMSIMMNPVLGKELFELMSLCISALNGCELCVNAHEDSLLKLGSTEERIFDAVRLTAIFKGLMSIN